MNDRDTRSSPGAEGEHDTLRVVRSLLLGILVVGSVGTMLEFGLLEHTEDRLQWIPLVLLSTVLACIVAVLVSPRATTLRTLRWVSVACVLSGFVGIWQHFSGNMEFALEMRASLAGWELFAESIDGAFPLLAPGTMSWLGLLGLVYTYRHPLLGGPPDE